MEKMDVEMEKANEWRQMEENEGWSCLGELFMRRNGGAHNKIGR
jgi:hypothetical protein